jgi:response regulator RpfG family c-di-GMP phosphodiesterase
VASFDFVGFAMMFFCCLSLVATAALVGHQWQSRRAVAEIPPAADLQQLGEALHELERGTLAGLQQVGDGYVAMALQVVDGLERRRLVPPGHGERTAALAARLAHRLQLEPTERRELDTACRLVDLGKAWVRPSILQKQTRLTDVEARSLRHHPVRAAEQLERVPALRGIARLVRHQLERYDGSGAPDGLRGTRTPVGARVLAIAAAFDLLTNCAGDGEVDWPRALQQLEQARGEVFDPELVKLFAEEIRKAPPQACADRDVMIIPCGALPWREAKQDDEDDEGSEPDLEVLTDEPAREEPA